MLLYFKQLKNFATFSFATCALQKTEAVTKKKQQKLKHIQCKTKITNKVYTAVSKELLFRGGYIFFCICISSVSAWVYKKEVLYLYLYPLLNLSQNVIFTSISEAFYTTLSLCISIGLCSAVPFLLYEICCFFLPSLFPEEKNQWYTLCFSIIFLYVVSIWFCTIYVIPELCQWFLKFSVSTDFLLLSLQARISNYVSWSGNMYLFCVCIFEIPIIFLFALKYLRYGFAGSAVILAEQKQDTCFRFCVLPLLCKYSNASSCRAKASTKAKGVEYATSVLSQNRLFTSIVLLLLCACISPPDVYSQSFLFFFSIIGYECLLWYSFLQETLNKFRQRNVKQANL